MGERLFRVGDRPAYHNGGIPWSVIAPHEAQAKRNHGGQTLERLHERGGLSWAEAAAVLEDRKFRQMDAEAAKAIVLARATSQERADG